MPPSDKAKKAVPAIRGYLETLRSLQDRPVSIAVRESHIPDIINDGRFKSQFETGSSGGLYDPTFRATAERSLFGYPANLPDHERPIYGHFSDRTLEPSAVARGYGYWNAVLDPARTQDATITLKDSLGATPGMVISAASPLSLPGRRALRETLPGKRPLNRVKSINAGRPADYDLDMLRNDFSAPYIEAQVHKGVPWSDVRALVYNIPGAANDFEDEWVQDRLHELVKRAGVPAYIHAGDRHWTADPNIWRKVEPGMLSFQEWQHIPPEALKEIGYRDGGEVESFDKGGPTLAQSNPLGWLRKLVGAAERAPEPPPPPPPQRQSTTRLMLEALRDLQQRPVSIATPEQALRQIIDDGRFKTQFETGNSQGIFNPATRAQREAEMFGTPTDISPEHRPVYGHFNDRRLYDSGQLRNYGRWNSVLDPARTKDATITLGDSLFEPPKHVIRPEEMFTQEGRSRLRSSAGRNDLLRFIQVEHGKTVPPEFNYGIEQLQKDLGRWAPYIEAQVHGGVPWTDVRGIVHTGIDHGTGSLGDDLGTRMIDFANRGKVPVFAPQYTAPKQPYSWFRAEPGMKSPADILSVPEEALKEIGYQQGGVVQHFQSKGAVEPVAKKVRGFLQTLRDLEKRPVSIATDGDVLQQIIEDGRFKSQFETGRSNGLLDPDYRTSAEKMLFGYPRDLPDEQRPIYGHISNRALIPSQNTTNYGNFNAVLDPARTKDATLTMGDSLGWGSERLYRPELGLAQPNRGALRRSIHDYRGQPFLRTVSETVDNAHHLNPDIPADDLSYLMYALHTPYIEAQVHKGVPWSDVRGIVRNTHMNENVARAGRQNLFKDMSAGWQAAEDPMLLDHMMLLSELGNVPVYAHQGWGDYGKKTWRKIEPGMNDIHEWHSIPEEALKEIGYADGGEVRAFGEGGVKGVLRRIGSSIRDARGADQFRRFERLSDETDLTRFNEGALKDLFMGTGRDDLLTTMNPAHFERYAEPISNSYMSYTPYPKWRGDEVGGYDDYIKHLSGIARGEGFDDVPFLTVGSQFARTTDGVPYPVIGGHEGRHRMRALADMGDRTAPVRLSPWGKPGKVIEALGQNDNRVMGQSKVDLDRMAERDPAGLDEWLKLMSNKLPNGVYADGGEVRAFQTGGTKGALRKLMTAYHGSPYDFDKFDWSKIGTGEGAQAYGYGHYLAENEGVAKHYRDKLRGKGDYMGWGDQRLPIVTDTLPESALDHIVQYLYSESNARRMRGEPHTEFDVSSMLPSLRAHAQKSVDTNQKLIEALRAHGVHPNNYEMQSRLRNLATDTESLRLYDEFEKNPLVKFHQSPGHMYEVGIDADPDKFLQWRKPLPDDIFKKFDPALVDLIDETMDNRGMTAMSLSPDAFTGNHLYQALKHPDIHDALPPVIGSSSWITGDTTPSRHTSAYLESLGIPGIIYPDATSRRPGGNSYNNIVTFENTPVSILRKYEQGGPVHMDNGGPLTPTLAQSGKGFLRFWKKISDFLHPAQEEALDKVVQHAKDNKREAFIHGKIPNDSSLPPTEYPLISGDAMSVRIPGVDHELLFRETPYTQRYSVHPHPGMRRAFGDRALWTPAPSQNDIHNLWSPFGINDEIASTPEGWKRLRQTLPQMIIGNTDDAALRFHGMHHAFEGVGDADMEKRYLDVMSLFKPENLLPQTSEEGALVREAINQWKKANGLTFPNIEKVHLKPNEIASVYSPDVSTLFQAPAWEKLATQYGVPVDVTGHMPSMPNVSFEDALPSWIKYSNKVLGKADGGPVHMDEGGTPPRPLLAQTMGKGALRFVTDMYDTLSPMKQEMIDKIRASTMSGKPGKGREALMFGRETGPKIFQGIAGDDDPIIGSKTHTDLPHWYERYLGMDPKQRFVGAHTHPNDTISPSLGDLMIWSNYGRDPKVPYQDMLIAAHPRGGLLEVGALDRSGLSPARRMAARTDIVGEEMKATQRPDALLDQHADAYQRFLKAHGINKRVQSYTPIFNDLEAGPLLDYMAGRHKVPITLDAATLLPGTNARLEDVWKEFIPYSQKMSIPPYSTYADGGVVQKFGEGNLVKRVTGALARAAEAHGTSERDIHDAIAKSVRNTTNTISDVIPRRHYSDAEFGLLPSTEMLPEVTLRPEDLKGRVVAGTMSDRLNTGSSLTDVLGHELKDPVYLEGGFNFPRGTASESNALWASDPAPLTRIFKDVQDLEKRYDAPVSLSPLIMGRTALDSTKQMSDVLSQLLTQRPMKTALRDYINAGMREQFPTWPGIRSPDWPEWQKGLTIGDRSFLPQLIDSAAAHGVGAPSMADVRIALTDPTALITPNYHSGRVIGSVDTSVPPHREKIHSGYGSVLSGLYDGGFGRWVPPEIMYGDDWATRFAEGPPSGLARRVMMRRMPHQYMDNRAIDRISGFLEEADRLGLPKAEGGPVGYDQGGSVESWDDSAPPYFDYITPGDGGGTYDEASNNVAGYADGGTVRGYARGGVQDIMPDDISDESWWGGRALADASNTLRQRERDMDRDALEGTDKFRMTLTPAEKYARRFRANPPAWAQKQYATYMENPVEWSEAQSPDYGIERTRSFLHGGGDAVMDALRLAATPLGLRNLVPEHAPFVDRYASTGGDRETGAALLDPTQFIPLGALNRAGGAAFKYAAPRLPNIAGRLGTLNASHHMSEASEGPGDSIYGYNDLADPETGELIDARKLASESFPGPVRMHYADGGAVDGYRFGGELDNWQGQPGMSMYADGGPVEMGEGGFLHDLLGTVGSLAGNLIPIPFVGPAIGKFAGHTLGNLVEGNTGEIGDDAGRDFTMGLYDADHGGFRPDRIPGLGGLLGGMRGDPGAPMITDSIEMARGGSVDDDALLYHAIDTQPFKRGGALRACGGYR